MVKRHTHADRDEAHVGMLDHFSRASKSVGNPEMLGRFLCGFLAARADRCDLELRKRAQGRNVGIAPPAVTHICSNDANTDFFCRHDVFSLLRLMSLSRRGRNYRAPVPRRPPVTIQAKQRSIPGAGLVLSVSTHKN